MKACVLFAFRHRHEPCILPYLRKVEEDVMVKRLTVLVHGGGERGDKQRVGRPMQVLGPEISEDGEAIRRQLLSDNSVIHYFVVLREKLPRSLDQTHRFLWKESKQFLFQATPNRLRVTFVNPKISTRQTEQLS